MKILLTNHLINLMKLLLLVNIENSISFYFNFIQRKLKVKATRGLGPAELESAVSSQNAFQMKRRQ